MGNIKLYDVDEKYVDYLSEVEPLLFHNKQLGQKNSRKYIGIVFQINDFDYFAPLSSFKDKHKYMKDGIDFIKIKDYAVINLNNMFPVPEASRKYVNINNVSDDNYKALLLAEYRYIKSIQLRIRKNAEALYKIKLREGSSTALSKRCNNFSVLESYCVEYSER